MATQAQEQPPPGAGGGGVEGPQVEETFGRVCVILVRGSGRLGLLVSPARRVGEVDVGLRIDGIQEDVARPELDQDMVVGDVFLSINDIPLLSFPTESCIRLLDLSSRCERRTFRMFRRGVITEEVLEGESKASGQTILEALGFAPELHPVAVPDGPLGILISPAQFKPSRLAVSEEVLSQVPSGWLRVDRRVSPQAAPGLEEGDVILRVNALPLDDFDFATSLRILQLARNRRLTVVKHQVAFEETMAPPPPEPWTTATRLFAPTPYFGVSSLPRYYPTPLGRGSLAFPPGSLRGWHLVSKRLDLRQLRGPYSYRGGIAA